MDVRNAMPDARCMILDKCIMFEVFNLNDN